MELELPSGTSTHHRTARLVDARGVGSRERFHTVLPPTTVVIDAGTCVVITGPNGSGKSRLGEILAARRPPDFGTISWPGLSTSASTAIGLVSFEQQEAILAREHRRDESWLMHGATDPGTTPGDLIAVEAAASVDHDGERAVATTGDVVRSLAERFGIAHILGRGLRFLSTGEFRKTLIVAALARHPRLVILDEPFDGLDVASRAELSAALRTIPAERRALVLVLNRHRDIPSWATEVVTLPPPAETPDPRVPTSIAPVAPKTRVVVPSAAGEGARRPASGAVSGQPVIAMRGVSVAYGETPVLRDVHWEVRDGERWLIHGPNGAGKSTLLSLITGDNPKAYGQTFELFGRARGSGESVWEIKRRIGFVSGDLQLRYPTRTRVIDAVLSGLHDSIGLYDQVSGYERKAAMEWLRRAGLAARADQRLGELSFGLRRLVLVLRAVIKAPHILIADEPTQGLDDHHARMVLDLLEKIGGSSSGTTSPVGVILYVTHNRDEALQCITDWLAIVPGDEGSRALYSIENPVDPRAKSRRT